MTARGLTRWLLLLACIALATGCPRKSGKKDSAPKGELRIAVEPAAGGGELYLNDELAGIITPDGIVALTLKAARYTVRLERDDYYTVYRVVDVAALPAPRTEIEVRMRERLE